MEVSHACVKYLDDQIKYYYEPIQSIFYKKTDKAHIKPKDLFDFEKGHKYYVLWQLEANKINKVPTSSENPEFYSAYIVCLGESQDDARVRAENKSKRLALPKKLTSSESYESLCEAKELKLPQNGKIIKNIVQKVNSQRTIIKYKQLTLMGNRKVLSLDRNYCVEKDNSKYNFENVENTENIQRTCRQFEVRVVLEDCLKGKKDILTHDNKKIGDYTIDILDHTMSLPYCSTPKPRMGKYSYSCSLEDYRSKNCESKFIRNCESYSAYEDQKLQKEFHTSQQKKYPQHVSSVVRDKNAALTISPLSPILSGCQLTPRKSKERTPRLSFSRQHQETSPPRFPAGTSQGSRSKNRSHSSVLSPGGLRSPQMSPGGLRSPQLSPGGFCSSGLSSERVGSSTPLGSLAGSFERSYSRTPSRSSSVSSKYSHSPQAPLGRTRLSVEYPGRHPGSLLSTHQPSPTKTTPRRKPGPLSRTRQQLPARTPPRQSPVRTPRRRPGPLSRTHQELPARTPPSQSPFRTPRRRPGPRCYTQHVQNQSQRSEESGISGEENDSSAVDMLEEYKPKLFKKYKKAGYDLTSVIPDRHKRYDIVHDKVYLDENVRVGRKSWRIMTYKRKSKFLRDLGTVLWTKKRIATRALDLSKLKKKNFGTQPIVLFSPRKLNLYLSLYRDYLDSSHRYRELPQDVKDILIKNSTESLSYHARDERKNQDEPTEETRNP